MKFCMVTTFFGGHSFGGDAAYVDRLCQALCRRGHEVHVYYCVDAFNAVRGSHPLREFSPPPAICFLLPTIPAICSPLIPPPAKPSGISTSAANSLPRP